MELVGKKTWETKGTVEQDGELTLFGMAATRDTKLKDLIDRI
jgi:hypothetical protein